MTDARFAAESTVEVTDVSKWFGQKVAVSELSCSFGPGVTGLLGPNGAGKTTFLRMLVGLLTPSEGTIRLLGKSPRSDPEVLRRVGFVHEDESVYEVFTAREFVTFNAALFGVADPGAAADRALDTVGLTDVGHRKVGTFSKGMRQRAKVAAALAHDPLVQREQRDEDRERRGDGRDRRLPHLRHHRRQPDLVGRHRPRRATGCSRIGRRSTDGHDRHPAPNPH